MADQSQKTEDVVLKDDLLSAMAGTLTDLKTMFTSLQSEVQALKTSSQTQDKTLVTEQIRDDIGGAEAKTADLVLASSKQSARDYDNAKMNQADEKDFALTTKFDGLKFGKQVMEHSDNYYNQLHGQRDQLFQAYLTHFSSVLSSERMNRDNTLSDERVQKDAIRTPEAQGGKAQGAS